MQIIQFTLQLSDICAIESNLVILILVVTSFVSEVGDSYNRQDVLYNPICSHHAYHAKEGTIGIIVTCGCHGLAISEERV